jgi:IclR family acetate operon transcriptional repressor
MSEPTPTAAEPRKSPRAASGILQRAVWILEALASTDAPTSVRGLADHAGLPKSATQRILSDLVEVGLATRDEATRHYQLGPRALALGVAYQRRVDVRRAALPHMNALRDDTGETVGLSVPLADQLLHVDQVESEQLLSARLAIGRPLPLWSGAPARVILADREDDEIRRVLETRSHTELEPVNPPDPEELLADVREVRRAGHSRALEETVPGVHTMSVPVRGVDGQLVAVLSVTAPSVRLPVARMDVLLPRVLTAARRISAELGWPTAVAPDESARS